MVATCGYLALSILLALLSSKLMKLIHLPNVTGYLIAGLLVGPYCLGLLPQSAVSDFGIISEVALGLIAFSIGAEFRLSYLKRVGKGPVVIAITESIGAAIFVSLVLLAFGCTLSFALALGAIAAATAPAATLMVVRQYKAKGPVTEMLLPVVALDDATTLIWYGLAIAVAKAVETPGDSLLWTILNPLIELTGAIALGAVAGLLCHWLTKWFTGRGNRLSVCLGLVLGCIFFCDWLGWSTLLCCMMLGAVFANLSSVSDKVFEQVDRFTPPVFMLFFFVSGASLNIGLLPSLGLLGVVYVVSRVVGKWLGTLIGARICRAAPNVSKYLGITLLPQAGVAIGLASVVLADLPDCGQEIQTIVLCATVIYELFGPVATKLALMKAGEIQKDAPSSGTPAGGESAAG